MAELFDCVLASQLRPRSANTGVRPVSPSHQSAPAVDMNRLLDMVGDDPAELRQIVDMFLTESQRCMSELRASIQAGDWDEAVRLAHRLAGTSATCGMAAMVSPLRELEITAKAG